VKHARTTVLVKTLLVLIFVIVQKRGQERIVLMILMNVKIRTLVTMAARVKTKMEAFVAFAQKYGLV
jgi:hypothetical protein